MNFIQQSEPIDPMRSHHEHLQSQGGSYGMVSMAPSFHPTEPHWNNTHTEMDTQDWNDLSGMVTDSLLYSPTFDLEPPKSNPNPFLHHVQFSNGPGQGQGQSSSVCPAPSQAPSSSAPQQSAPVYTTTQTTHTQRQLQIDPSLQQRPQTLDQHHNNNNFPPSDPPTPTPSQIPTNNPPQVRRRTSPPQYTARNRHNSKTAGSHQYRDCQPHRRPHSDAEKKYRHNMGDKFENLRQRLLQSSEFPVLGSSSYSSSSNPPFLPTSKGSSSITANSTNPNSSNSYNSNGTGSGNAKGDVPGTDPGKINKAFVLEQAVALIDRLEGVVREQQVSIEMLEGRVERVRELLGGDVSLEGPSSVGAAGAGAGAGVGTVAEAAAAARKKHEEEMARCMWIP